MNNIQRGDVTLWHALWLAKLQFARDRYFTLAVELVPQVAVSIEQPECLGGQFMLCVALWTLYDVAEIPASTDEWLTVNLQICTAVTRE
jgi:hypothetical protein